MTQVVSSHCEVELNNLNLHGYYHTDLVVEFTGINVILNQNSFGLRLNLTSFTQTPHQLAIKDNKENIAKLKDYDNKPQPRCISKLR